MSSQSGASGDPPGGDGRSVAVTVPPRTSRRFPRGVLHGGVHGSSAWTVRADRKGRTTAGEKWRRTSRRPGRRTVDERSPWATSGAVDHTEVTGAPRCKVGATVAGRPTSYDAPRARVRGRGPPQHPGEAPDRAQR